MKVFRAFCRFFSIVFAPIRMNGAFFVFMYVLGMVCAWITVPHQRGAHLYDNLYLELFFDLYLLCVVLSLLPKVLRKWVRRILYVLFYVVALIDVYCFVKFDSTLTPTMLLLVGETDSREATEFLRSYLSTDVLFSPVGWLILIIFIHTLYALRRQIWRLIPRKVKSFFETKYAQISNYFPTIVPYIGVTTMAIFVWSAFTSTQNKVEMWQLMNASTIGNIEHMLTKKDFAQQYTPINRMAFSLYANSLTSEQIDKLVASAQKARVDSCAFTSPNIVLIIGESYGKQHSQQYGYFMPTTPKQRKREKTGRLLKYTDVVSPWNLTSFVFKNVLSMHVVGQKGEWCDYPLFTELFRKAGYEVTFLTNQFLPKAKEAVYDFSGGFFLNNPKLSAMQFDKRNSSLHTYDEDLIKDYDEIKDSLGNNNLIIFHLIGQHVNYRQRSPKGRKYFTAEDYDSRRPELTNRQKRILADYDNATLYNDSIVDQICQRFENTDAIVIYMPDHGEECYEGNRGFICRQHSTEVDYDLAHYEFEIPFWIWCSRKYVMRHRKIYREARKARNRRFMTDALPHTLLYLAGISAPDYHAEYNVLSADYDENRPRLLKNSADYDKLRDAINKKENDRNTK